jgi:high-affinity iron transporter
MTARLAADEYRQGVSAGKVVLPPEVEEARLFLREARRSAERLPASVAESTVAALDQLASLVARVGEPDSLAAGVERMVAALSRSLSVELDEIPEASPPLARGAEVYRKACRSCHGVVGRGDGPFARGLTPPPADLTDRDELRHRSPLDFYRRITAGSAGTAMPAYETVLTSGDRWAVALYASTLRLPPPRGRASDSFSFSVTARLSDAELAESLGGAGLELVAAARVRGAIDGRDYTPIFATVRGHVDTSFSLARAGRRDQARSRALDAYMAFERVERELRVKEPALVGEIEQAFANARARIGWGDGDLGAAQADLERQLARAERAVGEGLAPLSLALQAFVILVREGLEAIVVLGALMTFLVKLGAGERRRDLHAGVAAAVLGSLVTAVVVETVFQLPVASQEVLEAVTMVAASALLFWVSYWMLSWVEVARWTRLVQRRLSDALGRPSSMALASVAFLAVYREGFETVLFFKALVLSGGDGPIGLPIGLGFLAGALVLAVVYLAIHRFGVRLPLRPFFAVSSLCLFVIAFNFAGSAIAKLQMGGLLPLTPIRWLPRIPALGVYPTAESALAQSGLLLLAVAALVWTFVVSPLRTAAPQSDDRLRE